MTEELTQTTATYSPHVTPVRVGPKSRLRRFSAWLKLQFQFSLATLLEWTFAYAAAAAIACIRADRLAAGMLIGVVFSALVARFLYRAEGRCVLPYVVFALLIGAGAVCGAFLLRDVRTKAVQPMLDTDNQTLMALETFNIKAVNDEKAALAVNESKIEDALVDSMAEAIRPNYDTELKEETISKLHLWFKSHVWEADNMTQARLEISRDAADVKLSKAQAQILAFRLEQKQKQSQRESYYGRQKDRFATRDSQLRQASVDLDVFIAPIPANADGWSPYLVPVDKRADLNVTCTLENASTTDVKNAIAEVTGLKCEIDPDQPYLVNLYVNDMNATAWIEWMCRLNNCDCTIDRKAGIVRIHAQK